MHGLGVVCCLSVGLLSLFRVIFDRADWNAYMDLYARECEAEWEIYN